MDNINGEYELPSIIEFDCTNIDTIQKLHCEIQNKFEFPYWYGKNWSAFRDLLALNDVKKIRFLNYDIMYKAISSHCDTFIKILEEHKKFYQLDFKLIF